MLHTDHNHRTTTILHFTFSSFGHWLFKFHFFLCELCTEIIAIALRLTSYLGMIWFMGTVLFLVLVLSISDIYFCATKQRNCIYMYGQWIPSLAQMLLLSHTSHKVILCLYLCLLFSSFYSCSATKVVRHKISDSLQAQWPFFGNTTLVPSNQISAAATITHFNPFTTKGDL